MAGAAGAGAVAYRPQKKEFDPETGNVSLTCVDPDNDDDDDECGGRYKRFLKLALNLEDIEEQFYYLKLAMSGKYSNGREKVWTPIIPPPEIMEQHFNGKLTDFWDPKDYLESFERHPVRDIAGRGNEDSILVYTYYVDATPFTAESYYGIFCTNSLTGRSELCCLLLKSDLCDCGCRGQCTIHELQDCLAHFCTAWAHGKRIARRHDDLEWLPSDALRAKFAGLPTK